ncbi:hypothetical protein LTR84_002823 [Exophiala bonariae]|uniref:Uncharacterized protein n=1 Tax=Exophiala bonariae TaxID=1690606 RepID=A0AAV9N8W5_9EURO|nr:hypothetical protein LTR84_002823 [Exophiala bonariae]
MTSPENEGALMAPNQSFYADAATSSIFTMIPSSVRSRIPIMSSIRASAKAAMLTRTLSSRRKAYTLSSLDESMEGQSVGFASTAPNSGVSTPTMRPQTPENGIRTQDLSLATLSQSETQSGVNWDVAATGIRLWITAKAQAEQSGDSAALRSMHIDAMRYMNMALPQDLTPLEIECLRASMSPALFQVGIQSQNQEVQPRRSPSILRKAVAQMVCWLFAVFLLIVPVFMNLLNRVVQFERQHQMTEKILSGSFDLGSCLGEPGSQLQRSFLRFKDSPLGESCVNAGVWVAEGLIGGVNDGMNAVAHGRAVVIA